MSGYKARQNTSDRTKRNNTQIASMMKRHAGIKQEDDTPVHTCLWRWIPQWCSIATCSQISGGTKINNPVHNTAKNMLAKKKHLWMKMAESGGQKQTRMLANSCYLQTTALGERERSSRNVTVYIWHKRMRLHRAANAIRKLHKPLPEP